MFMSMKEKVNDDGIATETAVAQKGKKRTVETTYQKKTQLEHILLRPDSYIGEF